jgi:subtilisin family serine protease
VFEESIRRLYLSQKFSQNLGEFKILHSFQHALHATVVQGITKEVLETLQGIEDVYPDIPMRKSEYAWGTDRIDQRSLPLDKSYNPAFNGKGVNVYVLDTGLDTTHIEFAANGITRNVTNIYNYYGAITDNTDGDGHGTHCAGTIGGNTVGVAKGVNIYGMKVISDEGSGSSSTIIAAMNEVISRHTSGSKSVISMSLGGGCYYAYCQSDAELKAVQNCIAAGIVVVVAAGNEFCNACFSSPAAAPNAITVGAMDISDVEAYFSNFGQCVDIFAPGVDIESACSSKVEGCSGGQTYVSYSGTSMATPHVAGVAAQLLQKQGSATPAEVLKAMECDAVPDILTLDAVDTLSKNLLLQTPKDDGSFGTCTMGSGCTDSCNSDGACLSAHLSSSDGSTDDICHCDGGYYGDKCESNNGKKWPTVTSCDSTSTVYMPITFNMTDTDGNSLNTLNIELADTYNS